MCPGTPWSTWPSCRTGGLNPRICPRKGQYMEFREEPEAVWARRGSVGQGLRPWNHYTHGTGSRASTAGFFLQQINIRFIFSHQSWECKKTLDTPGSALRGPRTHKHWAQQGLQCISWPGMQNLHFSLTFLGKKINISLNQMLFSTKLKELVMVVLF